MGTYVAVPVSEEVSVLSCRIQSIVRWVAYLFRIPKRDGGMEKIGEREGGLTPISRTIRSAKGENRSTGWRTKHLEKDGHEKGEVKTFEGSHYRRYAGPVEKAASRSVREKACYSPNGLFCAIQL